VHQGGQGRRTGGVRSSSLGTRKALIDPRIGAAEHLQARVDRPRGIAALLARYFERMKADRRAPWRHGEVHRGRGDDVFGIPDAHEDDALRACRTAVEMREAWHELEGRIGVATGEVVSGTEERLATGDALNAAAHLQQAVLPH
jgi:class 3 adenylate cyclase